MLTPLFNCGQQDLYAVCRLVWEAVTDNLADFTAFKAKYVAAFVTAREAEIDAAELLPDQEQRDEESRTLRVQLKNKAKEARDGWQRLKSYITEAFPEDELEIKLDAAGAQHYRKASNDDWAAVKRLLLDGNTFITDNTAALTAGGNMPVAFAATFTTLKTEFDTLNQSFFNAEQSSEIDTQTKIEANNNIFEEVSKACADGQLIFKNNEAVKKLYTFDQVLLTVTGPGNTGIKGTAKNSVTNLPVPNVLITFFGTDIEIITDADGKFQRIIAAGTYTIIVTCPGFQDIQITDFEIETGIMRTLNITLVPLP
jgi:hypothetical protein